jgi:putative chitinase
MSNFTIEELTHSETAIRQSIDNTPDAKVLANLNVLIAGLEQVRTLLNNGAINISSGFRSQLLNKAIGSKTSSAHCLGFAADFTCKHFGTPKQIVQAIKDSNIKYDQVIYEGTWVHISFAPALRRQTLTATFKDGIASYSPFL